MKNSILTAVIIFTIIIFSCTKEDDCDGKGTLSITNKSITNSLMQLKIDGANYGTLDPGETIDVLLAAGQHDWQLIGINGGNGCSEASVIIVECETSSFSCSAK